MKVAEFKEFVRLVALSDLDLGEAQLGFQCKPRLLVWYQGQHIGVVTVADKGIEIEGLSSEGESCTVEATRLSGALRLLPDEEDLHVRLAAPHLTLSIKGTRFALRVTRGSRPPQVSSTEPGPALIVSDSSLALLGRALSVLDEVTGKKVLKPVLAGTQVSVKGGTMQMRATDGVRAAILEIPVEGAEGDYGVIPVADMRAALSIFTEGSLKIERHEGRIDLTCGGTRVRLSLYPDEGFPDLLLALPQRYSRVLELSTQAIATAAKAAGILDTTSRVVLSARRGRIIFLVASQELGSFQAVGGAGDLDFEVVFEGGPLGAIESFGPTIKLHLNDAASPVMIEGEPGWRYWTSPLISAHPNV